MRTRPLTTLMALLNVAIMTVLDALGIGLAHAADPDFSHVPDILGGQTHLLRDDDLVLGQLLPSFQQHAFLTQGQQITSQSATTITSSTCDVFQTRVGRLFNLKNDVIISLAPAGSGCSGSPNLGFYVQDPQNAANKSQTNFNANANFFQIELADFNGDRFADIFYVNQDSAGIYTAVKTDDPTQGVTSAAQLRLPSQYAPPQANLVTGDFNGDGAVDVAWPALVNGQWTVFFASVCPATNAVVLGQTCSQPFQIIPSTQTITNLGAPNGSPPVPFIVLAAGDFDRALNAQGRPTQELFLAQSRNGNGGANQGHRLFAYSFDATLTPTQRSTGFFGYSSVLVPDQPFLASGKLGWFGQQDQVVFSSSQTQIISVITFDTNLNMTGHSYSYPVQNGVLYGLAVGRFDPPDVSGALNPNLQIAALFEPGVPSFGLPAKTEIQLFTVDPPTNFTPQPVSTYLVANQWFFPVNFNDPYCSQCSQAVPIYGNPLRAGDLQGRSLPLGAPQKVTVTGSIQPQVTLGLPPMHIDFIQEANSLPSGPPTVLNLSTLPSKFYSQYQTQQSGSNQSSNTNTTSYTFATKESAEAKLSYGIPNLASVSADLKTSAQQTHQNTVSAKYNTYTGHAFDVSTQTGFSDLVWFTSKRFNIYIYPVIGQTVCPQSQPNCTDAQKVPLTVQFSGPDQVLSSRIDGSLLEWYQPVQEPGNVFSYPWNATLLQNLYPGFNALTADPATIWATDSSGSNVSVTWTQNSGSDVTSGSVSTQSFDISTSVSASINIEGFGASASAGFDYNSSSSASTLNESSSMVGSSTGIKIFKPSFTNPGDYAYAASTYIFGQQAPTGTVQQIPLNTTVQSGGPLWTAFTTDPTDIPNGAGAWWPLAYTKPDVALNHPSRWTWTPPTPTKGDVLTFNPADPAEPALSEFYFMKGLYITPASANGQGSQITQTTAGESIQLQARVYNYSLADMPAGTILHVRFYGQESDFSQPAFVINEVMLEPIPGFNSTATGGTQPNWALAGTTFDTTNYGDRYLVFWVVVWMEQNGQLVPETTGHGITAIPDATTAPTGVAIEAYSNNLGFYKQAFYICPQGGCPPQSPPAATATAGALAVDDVTASPARVPLFAKAAVAATLASGATSLNGVQVFFYDGDPARGGEAFDAELVPHIRAHDTYVTRVKFQPRTCGNHRLQVVAYSTTGTAKGKGMIHVKCQRRSKKVPLKRPKGRMAAMRK